MSAIQTTPADPLANWTPEDDRRAWKLFGEKALVQTQPSRPMSPARIIDRVAELHGVTADLIKGDRQSAYIVAARHQAIYEVAKHGKSLTAVGRFFGGRHATTVHYAVMSWPLRAAKLGVAVDLEPEA